MLRSLSMLLLLPLVFGASASLAQTKKPSPPAKAPTAKDHSIGTPRRAETVLSSSTFSGDSRPVS